MPYYNYKHVTSTGVSSISISAGAILHGIVFNQVATSAVTASTGLVTVYAGTTTAASTDGSVIGILSPVTPGADYIYDVVVAAQGITIQVGSGVTPVDLTVIYD